MNHVGMGKKAAVTFFEGEKWLVRTGLLGFLLAAICGVWVLMHGGPVSPDGDVMKAVSFNAALGIFLLSTAAIMPFTALGKISRSIFRWSYILLALYSYGAETVQNFRGINPRFVKGGTPFDELVGDVFAFVALFLVLFYLFAAVQFFRSKAYQLRPELVLGIRYAMIAIMLSFAAGIWISVNHGRFVGQYGNIIWLHGLGFHALQFVPFIAWLSERSSFRVVARKRMIHLTGISYMIGLVGIGSLTFLGSPILEWSVLSLLSIMCFLIALLPSILLLLRPKSSAQFFQ
ncbi:hypothetical protein [Brevibacillus choshinensis]|uniref:hypothetical protein n=1 Tax=Brevibacillus choshinensis TaxID=54911 RepID=UPI002E1E1E15|nr:hypothetical protein [Brevibacillus choshinensis]